jgi:hypothetical protein
MNDDLCLHPTLHYGPVSDAVVCLDCFKTWVEEPEPCMLSHAPYCALPHYPSSASSVYPEWPQRWILTSTDTDPNTWKTTSAT